MTDFILERIDEIRFEVTCNGAKVSFAVIEPKGLELTNGSVIATGKNGACIKEKIYDWHSVFNSHTKIIIKGLIKETKANGLIIINHEGKFDFNELCKGEIVRID